MPILLEQTEISCAGEVFLATALLHREQPDRTDFTISEIVGRAATENLTGRLRSGVHVHASQHCVANRPPNPAKNRMLFATGKHTRRLLLPGDDVHQGRTGRVFPDEAEVPERYASLLNWAKQRFEAARAKYPMHASIQDSTRDRSAAQSERTPQGWLEGLLEMEGLGKECWKDVDPDEFVRKLREGWE